MKTYRRCRLPHRIRDLGRTNGQWHASRACLLWKQPRQFRRPRLSNYFSRIALPQVTQAEGGSKSHVAHRVHSSGMFWLAASTGVISPFQCAGLNRHEAEDERALRERSSDPLGLESCAATARDTAKRRQRIGGVGIQLRKDETRTPTSL